MRPRPVGHFGWLTGLGPPVVLLHAGGPPHDSQSLCTEFSTSPRFEGQRRAPIASESLDRVPVSRSACGSCWLDLVRRSDTPHALMKSGANETWSNIARCRRRRKTLPCLLAKPACLRNCYEASVRYAR